MKVKELITILMESGDPNAEVILSSDEEGNSYRPAKVSVDEVATQINGELRPLDPEDALEYDEVDLFRAVVFW